MSRCVTSTNERGEVEHRLDAGAQARRRRRRTGRAGRDRRPRAGASRRSFRRAPQLDAVVAAVDLGEPHAHVLDRRGSAGSCRRSRRATAARGGRDRRSTASCTARGRPSSSSASSAARAVRPVNSTSSTSTTTMPADVGNLGRARAARPAAARCRHGRRRRVHSLLFPSFQEARYRHSKKNCVAGSPKHGVGFPKA